MLNVPTETNLAPCAQPQSVTIEDAPALDSLIDRFLAAQDIADSSKWTYRTSLAGSFFPWLLQSQITNPRREDILAYKHTLQAKGCSALTISSYMTAVRRFFAWMEDARGYPNVARNVKGAKAPKGFRKDALTRDQTLELLASVARNDQETKRNFSMLNLMVRTGLRTIEVIRSDVGDIRRQGDDMVLYVRGKGRDEKDDFVLLTKDTLVPLMEYLIERGSPKEREPLFSSCSRRNYGERLTTSTVSRVAKSHLREINLDSPRLTAHSLRHTTITLGLRAGAKPQDVQHMARHSSLDTTMGYAHNIERIDNAAERWVDAILKGEPEKGIPSP